MNEVVECYVTHGDGHDAGVGNVDCAFHVAAIRVGGEFNGELRYVEALEPVEAYVCSLANGSLDSLFAGGVLTFHGDRLIIIYSRSGKSHLVEIRSPFNIKSILLATKYLLGVAVESIKVRDLHSLVHINCSLLCRVNGRKIDVSVRLLVGSIER